jgi:hypothetical protein
VLNYIIDAGEVLAKSCPLENGVKAMPACVECGSSRCEAGCKGEKK